MSMARLRPGAAVALFQRSGTRPRLANSSRTRGITPGSARAWTEKETVAAGCRSATAAFDGIGLILGKKMANRHVPGSYRARVGNSPDAGAMRRLVHPAEIRP